MRDVFARHDRGVLQFSGGKDSLACLHMLKPYWDRIDVLWMDTGDSFPETQAQMAEIEAMVPHFVTVRSDVTSHIEANGWPVEVLPVTRTPYGRMVDGHDKPLMQPYSVCCGENIWAPMASYVRESGAGLIIRGTRVADHRKSTIRSGDVVDGVEYFHPIEAWSSKQVHRYLAEIGVSLPSHYSHVDTSLDCRMCTAYLYENAGKMDYMEEHHPADYAEIMLRIGDIRDVLQEELIHTLNALGTGNG